MFGMVTRPSRRPQQRIKPPFNSVADVLSSRGYSQSKARGQSYWLWALGETFPIYCWNGKLGSNKVFIDAENADLANLLCTVKGIRSPTKGATKNNKFEAFSFKKTNAYTGIVEYEGWRFEFEDADATNKFLNICEAFAESGLTAASQVASGYEQVVARVTSKRALVATRVGQDDFRAQLIRYWKTCAVTGCSVTRILRASHLKPWSACDSRERLNPFNGLLLIPNLDALFDCGLITFADSGVVIVSTELDSGACIALGISPTMRLRKVNTAHLPFLKYHRENVFKG